MTTPVEVLRGQFEFFAEECAAAPFYRDLSLSVPSDPALMALADEARPGQRRANLLFAAVHFLVLRGDPHPLSSLFADAAAGRHPDGYAAFPALQDFCRARHAELLRIIRERAVQTNEVQRCAYLLPGLAAAQSAVAGRPLAFFDVGTSAGLHLLFDRYFCRYSNGVTAGPPGSPVVIDCEVRGALAPLAPALMPSLASRTGIDIEPVDVRDDEACLWLRALIWPEQPARAARLANALAIAREAPPHIVTGDVFDVLEPLVAAVPEDVVPCIHHSHTLAHFPASLRDRFTNELLPSLGARRDIAWLANEGLTMELTTWSDGVRSHRVLANRPAHGEWLEWLAG